MKGGKLAQPITGSNVIKVIIDSEWKQLDTIHREHLSTTVRAAFPGHTDTLVKQVIAVVEQVSVKQANEYIVKTKEGINRPKHLSVQVECHVHMDSTHADAILILEPDVNPRWIEGLELCDILVEVTRGTKNIYYCKCAEPNRPHSVSKKNCYSDHPACPCIPPHLCAGEISPATVSHNKSHHC